MSMRIMAVQTFIFFATFLVFDVHANNARGYGVDYCADLDKEISGIQNAPMSLFQVMRKALRASPDTAYAAAAFERDAHMVSEAEAAYFPTISANGGRSWARQTTTTYGNPSHTYSHANHPSDYGVLASWVVYDGGRREATLTAAEHAARRSHYLRDAAVQQVLFQAASSYVELRSAIAAHNVRVCAQRLATETTMVSKELRNGGIVTKADVLQAESEQLQMDLELERGEHEVKLASARLASLIGADLDTQILVTPLPVFDTGISNEMAFVLAEAVRSHPELRAARAQIDSTRASVSVAQALQRPRVTTSAEWSRRTARLSGGNYDYLMRGYNIGIRVEIPIFDGGAARYNKFAALKEVALQTSDYERKKRDLALNAWTAYRKIPAIESEIARIRLLIDNTVHTQQLVRERYSAGVATMLELLSAQRAGIASLEQLVDAQARLEETRFSLLGSLGQLTENWANSNF